MKKVLLFGFLPIAAFGIIYSTSKEEKDQGAYQPRNNVSQEEAIIEGTWELYQQLYGEYTLEDVERARLEHNAMPVDRTEFNWIDHGPDNVGGRTRAICCDRNDINHLYAGSVSGGLFESTNRANNWSRVLEFEDNLAISSMCQTADGTYYIACGHEAEGGSGAETSPGISGVGLYKMVRNADGTHTVTEIPGSSSFNYINEVVADTINNIVWVATSGGLKTCDGSTLTNVDGGISSGGCKALSISPDGDVIVCNMAGKTNVSEDGGATFTDYSSTANTSNNIPGAAARIEYGLSLQKNTNGKYTIFASRSNQKLLGVYMSQDNGVNWTQIAPANTGIPGSFAPFESGGGGGQGTYDHIIAPSFSNPNKLFIGGIDLYKWSTTGNWEQVSQWFLPETNPQYCHADQHEIKWDKWGRMYVGNDGGVFFSDDGGETFHEANRGYNVTQFYDMGWSAHGDVMGGTQDNGTQVNYHNNTTWQEHDEVIGGDGFSCAMSFANRDVIFGSLYYGSVMRSSDRGATMSSFVPNEFATEIGCVPGDVSGNGCGQFYTKFALWENPNDLNSTDSIQYIPSQAYLSGETVEVPSRTTGATINYVTPTDIVYDDTVVYNPGLTTDDTTVVDLLTGSDYFMPIINYSFISGAPSITVGDSLLLVDFGDTVIVDEVILTDHYYGTNSLRPGKVLDMGSEPEMYGIAWDTLLVQDHFQSWFVLGLGGTDGIWMTRNATRFSADLNEWFRVTDNSVSAVSCMEFSRDGNHLFIGTWGGALWRLSGFGNVYSPAKEDNPATGAVADTLIDWDAGHYATTLINTESFGAAVTGIAVEGDPDHVVVTLGGYSGSGKVRETFNATGADPTFTNIGSGLPSTPMFSCVIDRDDPNTIVVGGEFGTYYTENGGSTWTNCSGPFGNTPVFDMEQNWRTWNEGSFRPGEIYIGTHGRGIWSTEAYLGLPESQDNLEPQKFIPNINVYPNPLSVEGNLAFELTENSDVFVQIFDLNGRMVQEIAESNMPSGNNNIVFNTADLPKGTYIVRLTAGDMVETTKFIKY